MKIMSIMLSTLFITPLAFSFELSNVDTMKFSTLDMYGLHTKEVQREKKGEAPQFAVVNEVKESLGEIQFLEEGTNLVWRKRIHSPNAISLNFAFTKFKMSENSEINIFSSDRTKFLRSYTKKNNNPQNELWSAIIMSDDVIVELVIPTEEYDQVKFELGRVNQGFRTFAQKTNTKSGSCNIDVVCSEGDGWREEINSVAVISTGGSTFCTGFMVNNTRNDKTPFFMTADHCRITKKSAPSLVTYWNYQTQSCGGSRNGTLSQYQSGSQFLASGKDSDFTLVKLNSQPNAKWNVRYAGWDNSGDNATVATAIHHPSTDEKSISFENDGTTRTSYLDKGSKKDITHVKVANWDIGTTEPGSSGSPLFDQNHRVIGQLHGGWASCRSATADYYGSFETSWSGDGTDSGSLSSHLDPDNTGDTFVDTI